MEKNPYISVVSPVYGAASLLHELVRRTTDALSDIPGGFEIILVEDHSPDESWAAIQAESKKDPRVRGISLSRNFGQQSAIQAGLDAARGTWVLTLDCDLQDTPEVIPVMLQKATSENLDILFAARKNRRDGFVKKAASRLFYRLLGYLSETPVDPDVANFVLYHRRVVNAMKNLGDFYRYYPMINRWVGFRSATISIEHAARTDNRRSSYSFRKRIVLAIHTILSFSDKPLRMVMKLGIMLVLFTMVVAIALVIRYFIMGAVVSGWLSVFLSIWFLSGIIILILGIVGLYLGKTFETVKRRPTYIIRETTPEQADHA